MKNPMGLNNFDKLEAAGLYSPADNSEGMKAKTEARVQELTTLIAKLQRVEAYLAELYTLEKPKQLKRLAAAHNGLKALYQQKLPVGAKKHIEACLNEVISLREGVYASNSRLDRQTLALTASHQARKSLQALAESAEHRLEKVVADSSSELDLEDFYKKAADIINKNQAEAGKVESIKDKPWVLVRIPVVTDDRSVSAERLPRLGFKSESLSGYPVIHNQLVLGVNPKMMASHDHETVERFAEMSKKLKESGVNPDEIKRLRGKIKDLTSDLGKIDPEKVDKKYQERLENELAELTVKVAHLIEKAGVDPDEMKKLQDKVQRSHAAQPKAVKEEAEKLRKLIEKKKGAKFKFVSEKPCSYKSGIWFWLMPDRELDLLAQASKGKRVNIQSWGFPFN